LVAALNFDGICRLLLKRVVRRDEIFSSDVLLEELKEKLTGKFGWSAEKAHEAVNLYRDHFTLVAPKPLDRQVCRDRDDDHVIAVALEAGAEAVITGDKDLLVLVSHDGVRFVSPRDFWEFSGEH
jgi:putative PIN family toxin of toxin-antitoxin system